MPENIISGICLINYTIQSMKWYHFLFLLFAFPPSLEAEIHLPSIISSGMVLQQKTKISLWGQSEKNAPINVWISWSGETIHTHANDDGSFFLNLRTPQAGGPYKIKITDKNSCQTLDNILIGEVWFSSGQSNMEWSLRRDANAQEELPNATHPMIRIFNIKKNKSERPAFDFTDATSWQTCDSASVANFSGISYFFARELFYVLRVPIGIISASWGGTPAEAWTCQDVMRTKKPLEKVYKRWEDWDRSYLVDSLRYAQDLTAYRQGETDAKPTEPESVFMIKRQHRRPGILFNGMVNPIIPYTIKGVIWYQGTSNQRWPKEYLHQMEALINGWRKSWNNDKLPFLMLQLCKFNYANPYNASLIRENQLKATSLPNCWISSSIDLGLKHDIHPPGKYPFGKRLADLALNKVYLRKEFTPSGPIFDAYSTKGSKIIIRFTESQGLHIKGEELNGIFIAGPDSIFYPAQTCIRNNKLEVWSDKVSNPQSVRYGWNNPENANLFNAANLPATTFRTDCW